MDPAPAGSGGRAAAWVLQFGTRGRIPVVTKHNIPRHDAIVKCISDIIDIWKHRIGEREICLNPSLKGGNTEDIVLILNRTEGREERKYSESEEAEPALSRRV
jgi:hypothetical protein